MNHDIHLYLAVGRPAAIGRYPLHEAHALHVYVRVPRGHAFDGPLAEAAAASGGWTLTEIRNASVVTAESMRNGDEAMQATFNAAQKDGAAVLVYDQPIPGDLPPRFD
jgi:hypothetical protein